ncbi:chemotaxis protein CheA [bacterium BMS3Abin07]|nr:chemotaxis protein CheA [bacterium BMS3Abin07]GBE32293.1 chemotaxis protein CheA [bacterium BMS3Bbin05]HDO22931.1 hybrid sensor histidine kinase/response regulator [Nitrospirota bacterium]HDZ87615.1 hybrid sensor histidine kinase/response regulator [Nitrospirota bacterium]
MAEKPLLDFFLAEAEDHLGVLEKGFLDLEKNPSELSEVQELFRAAHTLKGSAALVKLNIISEVAHSLEDVLESIRDGNTPVTRSVIDWFLHTHDSMKFLISEIISGNPEKKEIAAEVQESLKEVFSEKKISKNIYSEKKKVIPEKRQEARRKQDIEVSSNYVRVHVDNIEQMMNLVGELTILKNYLLSETKEVLNLQGEVNYANSRLIKEIDEFSSRYAYSIPDKISYVDTLLEDFRELEFDRYDELNLFARKLHEIIDDITEGIKSLTGSFVQFSDHVKTMERLNTDMRNLISQSRMVEAGRLFQRFTRTIRSLAHQSDKKVRFVVSGTETRIDKVIYERLSDPLLHIIRNSISHGIESPEERVSKGKSEEGRISLLARREGNSVVIDVKDDGRGVDLKSVHRKAVKMGILQKGERLTKGRLISLLFRPGFSTHEETDMMSGRGVGLDVVREAIAELNGKISVATSEGKGTIFRIKLPLTLVIINTVKLKAGGIEFVVPSSLIQELIEVDMHQYDREKESVPLRESHVQGKDLCDLLRLDPVRPGTKIPAIVFNLMLGKQVALLVDEITGQEDTVIKPLGRFLEGLRYYAGVSISADGKLMPVLSPVGLLERPIEIEESIRSKGKDVERGRNILIVDDSLSVRKFVSIILEQKGYNVYAASNGMEALTIIDEHPVDLIITDLEMPVMHGYELLRELKRRGLSWTIPTVVLTSRGSEKHKEKAASLGAKDYLIKPFEEETLLQTVSRHLKTLPLT